MPKNLFSFVAAPLTAVLLSLPAHAAVSTDLKLTATILPSSCNIMISNNGVIDYDDINAATLNSNGNTYLKEYQHPTITNCVSPVYSTLRFIDNRAGTALLDNYFGLGLDSSGQKIGYAHIGMSSPGGMGDNFTLLRVISSADGGASWQNFISATTNTITSFSKFTEMAPSPFRRVEFNFLASAVINAADNLEITREIVMNGSITFELTYI
jgi:hypothetical protein